MDHLGNASLVCVMSPAIEGRENREFASELKFLVDHSCAEKIRAWSRLCLAPDPNCCADFGDAYRISSLYFDTDRFDVFHRQGSFGRSKYRIRRYEWGEIAFLERKLKTRGLVSKRRSPVKLEELARLDQPSLGNGWRGFWFCRRLVARQLKPICQITYLRTARFCMTELGPIRLTLDENIQALPVSGLHFDGTKEGIRVSDGQVILELKFRLEMPALFKNLLREFALNPQPVSKYRLAVVALGFVPPPPEESNGESDGSLCLIS